MVNMTHFSHSHLRPDLAAISASFGELAHAVLNTLPMNAERTTCLRKLLEAKDCAVRAYLEGASAPQGQAASGPPATPGEDEGAGREPTPEEDGVGAPMAQSSIESEAMIHGTQEKAARAAPTPPHRQRGAAK